MSLADRTPPVLMKGPLCRACALHESLTPEDQATLTEWLDRSRYTAEQILTMLAEEGYALGGATEGILTRHRQGRCFGRRNGTL